MTRAQRLRLLAAGVVVLVVAIVVIAFTTGGGGAPSSSAAPATIVVRHAKPVGGVRTLTYRKGQTIDLTVHSVDTADEVHFHGYDLHKDVKPGSSVRFRFPATIDGEFIVELESRSQTLATVRVEP